MNISKYIIYYPYVIAWSVKKLFNKKKILDFYCGNIVDYICIKKVLHHYPEMRIVAKNRSIQKSLQEYGVTSILYPTYPDVVVMCRHSARKYPGKKIKKIGLRHGPYHFKDFINAKYYNEFDSYLFTSPREVEEAKAYYTKAIELNPKYILAYNNRGNARKELGQHKEAIKDFDKAIQLNPKHIYLYSCFC